MMGKEQYLKEKRQQIRYLENLWLELRAAQNAGFDFFRWGEPVQRKIDSIEAEISRLHGERLFNTAEQRK